MNARRLTFALAVALSISGSCTYLLSRNMTARSLPLAPDRKYVAPTRFLQAGEILKANNLHVIDWPASNPLIEAFIKPEDLIGRVVLYPIDKNQPLTNIFLAPRDTVAGLARKIPNGMRAIALRSDDVMGVAGFLQPGSHLDVLATLRTDKQVEPSTVTVLQDAEVLAAGHQMDPDPEGKSQTVTVVTLLLNPADAQRAVLASSQGEIHFVLRSGLDKAQLQDPPTLLSQLAGHPRSVMTKRPSPISAEVKRSPAPSSYVIETINGDKQMLETFSSGGKL